MIIQTNLPQNQPLTTQPKDLQVGSVAVAGPCNKKKNDFRNVTIV